MTNNQAAYTMMAHKLQMKENFAREQIEGFLEVFGLKFNDTGRYVINQAKTNFIKDCLREDLGISKRLNLKLLWYDTGNAFSVAKDPMGNHIIQIRLGSQNNIFQVGFNKRTCRFIGLYYEKELVTEELLMKVL